jgi:hypothetical protein
LISPCSAALGEGPKTDLVIIAAHAENVSWVKEISRKPGTIIEVKVYQSSDPSGEYYVRNYCFEAGKYLEAILDIYDSISSYRKILFLHGHLKASHNLGQTALEIINDWTGWDPEYRFIAVPTRRINHNKMNTARFALLKELQSEYEESLRNIPEYFESACCAQFGINSKAIAQHPKGLWESALKLCYDTKIHKRYPGLKRVSKKHMSNINLGQNTGICFERYWKALFAPECAPKEAFSCK